MRFAVMIEGQEDVGWDDWLALARDLRAARASRPCSARTTTSPSTARTASARSTRGARSARSRRSRRSCGWARSSRPATFRHPSNLAKLVVTADHISGGRIELGHRHGLARRGAPRVRLPATRARWTGSPSSSRSSTGSFAPGPFSFPGEHYVLEELDAQPKPVQRPLPLIMGGAAKPRGAALAARYAAEYNVVARDAGGGGARPASGCAPRARTAGRDPAR